MRKENKQKLIDLIYLVKYDCDAQKDALNERGDVQWSCYEAGNWENLSSQLNEALKILGVTDES